MDALDNGESEYVNAVYLVKEAIAVRQRTPWYWPEFLYDCLPVGRAVNHGINVMHQYAYKVSNVSDKIVKYRPTQSRDSGMTLILIIICELFRSSKHQG